MIFACRWNSVNDASWDTKTYLAKHLPFQEARVQRCTNNAMGRTEIAIHTSAIERELLQIRKVSWYFGISPKLSDILFFTVTNKVEGCYFVSRDPFVTPSTTEIPFWWRNTWFDPSSRNSQGTNFEKFFVYVFYCKSRDFITIDMWIPYRTQNQSYRSGIRTSLTLTIVMSFSRNIHACS